MVEESSAEEKSLGFHAGLGKKINCERLIDIGIYQGGSNRQQNVFQTFDISVLLRMSLWFESCTCNLLTVLYLSLPCNIEIKLQ